MSRTRTLALAACAAAALATPAGAFTNAQIPALQVALQARGFYRGPIDGIAGPQTAAAIRAFQHSVGLEVDGLAGPRTRRALGRLGRPLFGRRDLQLGAIGWDVSTLQFLLSWQGFAPPHLNGNFGPGTDRALRRFQRHFGLAADGIAGPATRAALLGTGRPKAVAKPRPKPRATYRVRPGDSLTAIATRYGTSVRSLARSNHLSVDRYLLIGTRLVVPFRPPALIPRASRAAERATVQASLDRWSRHYSVNPHLARALAWMESGFQTDITSSVGAWGVLQVTPETWSFVESVLVGFPVPRTTDGSARVGVAYLAHLLRQFDGDERLALAGYYQGPASVRKRGVLPVSRAFIADVQALKARM
jgi:peptidoglycan hydrolase-like protein with peptidoglycan-binding domain